MQLKHTIAAALSLFLLCASSLASACELSCSLAPSHPVSMQGSGPMKPSTAQASEPTASAMTMSHSHCGHAGMGRHGDPVDHRFEDASTCTSAPCTQAPILSAPMSGKDSRQMQSSHLAVIIAAVPAVSAGSIASDPMRLEHAPPRLILVDPLSVALRI
jgi:hypothetical protein